MMNLRSGKESKFGAAATAARDVSAPKIPTRGSVARDIGAGSVSVPLPRFPARQDFSALSPDHAEDE